MCVATQVVYRGLSTSSRLQEMHDEAIAKRTRLRLQGDTARVEQAEQALNLRCREEQAPRTVHCPHRAPSLSAHCSHPVHRVWYGRGALARL